MNGVDELSDSELIARSFEDPNFFGAIFDRHGTSIGDYFARRVNGEHVEALMSEVFLSAFKSRASYDVTKLQALPWLYGISYNHLRHHYRSERRSRDALRHIRIAVNPADLLEPSFEPDRDAALDAAQELKLISEFLVGQPEPDREALLLYAWEELSYEEVAQAMSIPVGTVRSRMNRIRKKIRELDVDQRQRTTQQRPQVRKPTSAFSRVTFIGDQDE